MRSTTLKAIKAHAAEQFPKECCGVIVGVGAKERYVPITNTAQDGEQEFVMHKKELAQAYELGEVIAIVHSHPNAAATASEADKVHIEATQLPWYIVSVFIDSLNADAITVTDPLRYEPCGYKAPLLNRMFYHGVLDCYAAVRDHYDQVLGIELPDFEREDNWWANKSGPSLYLENFGKAGFVMVSDQNDIQEHDVILMEILSENGPNHAAVYLGDGKIYHHCYGRLSTIDIYGGYWQLCTRSIIRHKTMLR